MILPQLRLLRLEHCDIGALETCETSTLCFETKQISVPATEDICPVSTHNVEVSEISTVPISQCSSLRSLNCGNVTMFKSQIGGLAPNRRKWPEMGPEWSPGPENRPPGMPRPFPRLWDRSRGPKPTKKVKKSPVWGLALGSLFGFGHAMESVRFTELFQVASLDQQVRSSSSRETTS